MVRLAIVLFFAATTSAAAQSSAAPVTLTLANYSTQEVVGVCISPAGSQQCQSASDVVRNATQLSLLTGGQSVVVAIPPSNSCYYELGFVFKNGVIAPSGTISLCGHPDAPLEVRGDPHPRYSSG